MGALMECPACHTILEENHDEEKVHGRTYVVFDLDEDTRIIICDFCGFAGNIDLWPI